jgi:hypothetical protein
MKWLLLLTIVCGISCYKQFDEPPAYTGVQLSTNTSIQQLRSMHITGGFEKIFDELVIEGIVIANDSSDNFYRSIVLQDSTGGITLKLDASGLYALYPVGMKLYVRLKGLWLGDYARMIQLGAAVDRADPAYPELVSIPQPLFDRYLLKGSLGNLIRPVVTSIDQLNDSLQSCLVSISNVELLPSDTGKSYADAVNRLSVNHSLRACTGGNIYLRTSGFAGFAAQKTPRGNGTVTAIYTVFRNEKQLLIRDTSDMQLKGLRCTGAGAKQIFYENFENSRVDTNLYLVGWKNIAEAGGKYFQSKTASNNRYAEISAFATAQASVVSWLISPPINLSGSANEVLGFLSKDGYDNGATLQVLISTNYDGGPAPAKAKWTVLKAAVSKGSVNGYAGSWQFSGNIGLNGFNGTVHIAFRYEGADPPNPYDKHTTSFLLDEVRVDGN